MGHSHDLVEALGEGPDGQVASIAILRRNEPNARILPSAIGISRSRTRKRTASLVTFEDQRAVFHHMLKNFAAMLGKVAADYPDVLVVVRTQGTLQANEWANEIHPTQMAISRIADLIDPPLRY